MWTSFSNLDPEKTEGVAKSTRQKAVGKKQQAKSSRQNKGPALPARMLCFLPTAYCLLLSAYCLALAGTVTI